MAMQIYPMFKHELESMVLLCGGMIMANGANGVHLQLREALENYIKSQYFREVSYFAFSYAR